MNDQNMSKMEEFRVELEEIRRNEGELCVAIVGRDGEYWKDAMTAAESCADVILPLPEDLKIHEYKRILIRYHCHCLMYSSEFEELAYHVENDGVTWVQSLMHIG